MVPMRRRALVHLLSLTALVASPLAAQRPDAALERRVDSVFAPFARTDTPGCAVGVAISESGSVAKQFVAAALVLLVLDGKLSLDDDIRQWVPEVAKLGKRITPRHLLSHTSGLPDRYLLHEMEGNPAGEVDHPNAEVMDIVSRLRELNFDPGEDYLYSNTGYVVAAAVLERVSGQSGLRRTAAPRRPATGTRIHSRGCSARGGCSSRSTTSSSGPTRCSAAPGAGAPYAIR
jgi:hypothetical protein